MRSNLLELFELVEKWWTPTSVFRKLPFFILNTPSKKFTHPFSLVGPFLNKYIYLIKKEVAQYIKNSPRIIFNSQLYFRIPRFLCGELRFYLTTFLKKKKLPFLSNTYLYYKPFMALFWFLLRLLIQSLVWPKEDNPCAGSASYGPYMGQ